MVEGPIWTAKNGESNLDALRREYEQQGHPKLLKYALQECRENDEAPPAWLVIACSEHLEEQSQKRPGRGKRSPSEAARQYKIDYARGLTIRMLRNNDVPAEEVYEAAAQHLEGHPTFAGSESAMRASWRRIKNHFR